MMYIPGDRYRYYLPTSYLHFYGTSTYDISAAAVAAIYPTHCYLSDLSHIVCDAFDFSPTSLSCNQFLKVRSVFSMLNQSPLIYFSHPRSSIMKFIIIFALALTAVLAESDTEEVSVRMYVFLRRFL